MILLYDSASTLSMMDSDELNMEKYVKELAIMTAELGRAAGRMFQQEHLRCIAMIIAAGGASGVTPCGAPQPKGVIEHEVVKKLKAVNGDKATFKQCHQKLTTTLWPS